MQDYILKKLKTDFDETFHSRFGPRITKLFVRVSEHSRQSIGVHGVRTPPERRWKGGKEEGHSLIFTWIDATESQYLIIAHDILFHFSLRNSFSIRKSNPKAD